MRDDPLYDIASEMVRLKGNSGEKLRDGMIEEVLDMMHQFTDAELLGRMNPEEIKRFTEFLATEPTDQAVIDFIDSLKINMVEVQTAALTKFRIAYLGV